MMIVCVGGSIYCWWWRECVGHGKDGEDVVRINKKEKN